MRWKIFRAGPRLCLFCLGAYIVIFCTGDLEEGKRFVLMAFVVRPTHTFIVSVGRRIVIARPVVSLRRTVFDSPFSADPPLFLAGKSKTKKGGQQLGPGKRDGLPQSIRPQT